MQACLRDYISCLHTRLPVIAYPNARTLQSETFNNVKLSFLQCAGICIQNLCRAGRMICSQGLLFTVTLQRLGRHPGGRLFNKSLSACYVDNNFLPHSTTYFLCCIHRKASIPILEDYFTNNQFPSRSEKLRLAKISEMTYKQIDIWVCSSVFNTNCKLICYAIIFKVSKSPQPYRKENQNFAFTYTVQTTFLQPYQC